MRKLAAIRFPEMAFEELGRINTEKWASRQRRHRGGLARSRHLWVAISDLIATQNGRDLACSGLIPPPLRTRRFRFWRTIGQVNRASQTRISVSIRPSLPKSDFRT
jgi:hypothetical protein